MSKEIPLTKGYVAIVDDDDYEMLSALKWRVFVSPRSTSPYAVRSHHLGCVGDSPFMHRQIMGLRIGDKQQVDHINGDGLDNRRSNLRLASARQNMSNRRKLTVGLSAYKGVNPRGPVGPYRARIRVNGRLIHIGQYAVETDAARAYDCAATHYFGEFALLNFPAELFAPKPDGPKANAGFRGVTVVGQRYRARIRDGNELIQLGLHDTAAGAARAYDVAARALHRTRARLNFPE